MKILIQKISLLVFLGVSSLLSIAQTIEVSASVNTFSQVIANGSTFDATVSGLVPDLTPYLPVTITIKNTGSSVLTLTKVGGKYIVLSGSGAPDFVINESSLTGTIAAGASQTFTVGQSPSATTGNNKIVTVNIKSNDPVNGTYAGSIKYSFTTIATSIVKASDIGLSLYPNPSNDGRFSVKADNIDVSRIVVSNINGVTEEYTSKEFNTNLKGLLLIQVYTNKGLVSEKVLVQ